MSQTPAFFSSPQPRARWMRHDVAQLLKRFFFCERSLVVTAGAWICDRSTGNKDRHGSFHLAGRGDRQCVARSRLRIALPQPYFGRAGN